MKSLATGALAMLLALSPLAAISKVECPDLSPAQVKVLTKTWQYGEKRLGKGNGVKMVAVAYQETKLGKDTRGHGSYGVFQMQPATVADMKDVKITPKNLHGIKVRLTNEFEYSANEAARYLAYWKAKGYSDAKMFGHYNGGNKVGGKQMRYSRSVQNHVNTFNQCYVYRDGEIHERKAG